MPSTMPKRAATRNRPLKSGQSKEEACPAANRRSAFLDPPIRRPALQGVQRADPRAQRKQVNRDVIRHNGSVVILALDKSESKKDPLIVIERQFRHAAQQYLYEVPAGKIERDENHLAAAKRELMEETGYRAKSGRSWSDIRQSRIPRRMDAGFSG